MRKGSADAGKGVDEQARDAHKKASSRAAAKRGASPKPQPKPRAAAAAAATKGGADGGGSADGGSWLRRAHARPDSGRQGGGRAARRRQRPVARFTLYIQMQYCKRTLADVLAEGPMDEERIWRTLRQLAAGLQHVHAQVGGCGGCGV